MAQAPTYKDIEINRKQQGLVDRELAKMENTRENVDSDIQSNRNPILSAYMNEAQGLGNPNQVAPTEQELYSNQMIQGAVEGKINPEEVLKDPSVTETDKMALLSLMQGGPQDAAPIGLVPPM